MCLAVPMRIVSMDGHSALCEAKGVRRQVSLTLLGEQEVAVGDHVLIHVGYAIRSITEADAETTWELLDQIAAALDRAEARIRPLSGSAPADAGPCGGTRPFP